MAMLLNSPNQSRRIPSNQSSRLHILCHYAPCSNRGPIPNCHTRTYNRRTSDPAIFADLDRFSPLWALEAISFFRFKRMNRGIYLDVGADESAFADRYWGSIYETVLRDVTEGRLPGQTSKMVHPVPINTSPPIVMLNPYNIIKNQKWKCGSERCSPYIFTKERQKDCNFRVLLAVEKALEQLLALRIIFFFVYLLNLFALRRRNPLDIRITSKVWLASDHAFKLGAVEIVVDVGGHGYKWGVGWRNVYWSGLYIFCIGRRGAHVDRAYTVNHAILTGDLSIAMVEFITRRWINTCHQDNRGYESNRRRQSTADDTRL